MFNWIRKKDEFYYMNGFTYEIKEAWKCSMTDVEGFIEARKYLKKAKLDKLSHPYLWEFRERINLIDVNSPTAKQEIQEILKEFYRKKGLLHKMKNHNIKVVS